SFPLWVISVESSQGRWSLYFRSASNSGHKFSGSAIRASWQSHQHKGDDHGRLTAPKRTSWKKRNLIGVNPPHSLSPSCRVRVRYLGIEVADSLAIVEQVEI